MYKRQVTGNKINWLDAKLTGELISSKNIGSRPLYGTYATDNNADFKHDIEQWAIENGIDIEWTATPSLLKDIYYNLVHNGVGNVILTAFLLFISSMIAWFVLRAKGRSIRLLGGEMCIRDSTYSFRYSSRQRSRDGKEDC